MTQENQNPSPEQENLAADPATEAAAETPAVKTPEQEIAELKAIAAQDGIDTLQPWDTGYYSEKLKLQKKERTHHIINNTLMQKQDSKVM